MSGLCTHDYLLDVALCCQKCGSLARLQGRGTALQERQRRLNEIAELVSGFEDITDSGGPNIFMQIQTILKGEDKPHG